MYDPKVVGNIVWLLSTLVGSTFAQEETKLATELERTPRLRLSCEPGTRLTPQQLQTTLDSLLPSRILQNTEADEQRELSARAIAFPKVAANVGINALPPQRSVDPRIGEYYWVSTGLGFGTRGSEKAYSWDTSLDMPLGKAVALELDFIALEHSEISEARRAELGLPSTTATDVGDVTWAFRWKVKDQEEGTWVPDVGIRLVTQTASGAGENARFTDAARYVVELTTGKTVYKSDNLEDTLQEARLITKFGLDVPQDNNRQIDRWDVGLAGNFYFKNGIRADLDVYGYIGYDEFDRVINTSATVYFPLSKRFNVAIDATCGLTPDAPDFGAHVSFGFGDVSPYRGL